MTLATTTRQVFLAAQGVPSGILGHPPLTSSGLDRNCLMRASRARWAPVASAGPECTATTGVPNPARPLDIRRKRSGAAPELPDDAHTSTRDTRIEARAAAQLCPGTVAFASGLHGVQLRGRLAGSGEGRDVAREPFELVPALRPQGALSPPLPSGLPPPPSRI
ncbi:hypothetical protein FKP32DRAFT_1595707, partial [Trametes sanguinea]